MYWSFITVSRLFCKDHYPKSGRDRIIDQSTGAVQHTVIKHVIKPKCQVHEYFRQNNKAQNLVGKTSQGDDTGQTLRVLLIT